MVLFRSKLILLAGQDFPEEVKMLCFLQFLVLDAQISFFPQNTPSKVEISKILGTKCFGQWEII